MANRVDAGSIADTLERVGNAMQRPAIDAGEQFLIGAGNIGKRALSSPG